MKTHLYKFRKSLLAAFAASLVLPALPAGAALLFHEDWSGYTVNGRVTRPTPDATGYKWDILQGEPGQVTMVQNPTPALQGNYITPSYSGPDDIVLPGIKSIETFSLGTGGISLSTAVTFTNTGNYFRFGLEAANNPLTNYWFQIHGNLLQMQKRTGTSTSLATLDSEFPLPAGLWGTNKEVIFTFNITPLEGGGNRIELLVDGAQILFFDDTTSTPNFSSGFHIIAGFRSPQGGYVGDISLHSIPEPGTVAMVSAGAAYLLWIGRRRTRSTSTLPVQA